MKDILGPPGRDFIFATRKQDYIFFCIYFMYLAIYSFSL